MIEIYKLEQLAGQDQLMVAFVNRDESAQIDVQAMLTEVGRDAAEREAAGWRLVSLGGLPMRQMGTAGNVLFQSGGQFATQVAVVVVYARDRAAAGAG
ncbi:MAG: hypothetical protein WD830_03140 [Chloroflexota bacterium]